MKGLVWTYCLSLHNIMAYIDFSIEVSSVFLKTSFCVRVSERTPYVNKLFAKL